MPQGTRRVVRRRDPVLAEALEPRTVLSVGPIPAVPSPAALWTFDEGTGFTAADSSGNNHPATLGSAASWTAGNVGTGALRVTAGSNSLATSVGPAVNTAGSFTVSAWVNLAALGGFQTVVSIAGGSVAGFYLQLRGDTGTFALARLAGDSTSSAVAAAAASDAPATGTWYHLVGVDDVAAGTLTLYIDGQLVASAPYAGGWAAAGDTLIGHGFYGGQHVDFVNGTIDEVSLYPMALSSAQVAALDRPADYSFDDGAGTSAADVSGHGHTLTLGPAAAWTTGHVGSNALAFNGTSSALASYPGPVVDTAKSFSVSAWVNLNSLSGFQTFVSIDGANISGFYLQYRPDTGRFCFTRGSADSTGAAGWRADGLSTPNIGTWYHLLGVNDVANNRIRLYVDGVIQSSMTTSGAAWTADGATVIGAARFNGARVDYVNGRVDDVRFYNSPLSSQVAAYLPYVSSDTQAVINVSTASTGITVSPDLFGLFMEDINYGGEGGVYNDQVRNGGFNDSTNAINAWSAVAGSGVSATLTSDATTGPTAALTKSGKLTVASGVSASARVGVANSGFFGIAVTPSTSYAVEFYARATAGFRAPVTVSLESTTGVVYASATTASITGAWAKYTVTLTTGAGAPTSSASRLVISTNNSTANGDSIWFGAVHCFPPSYKNSPAHLRPDLMEKLAAMKPAFFRVPGGNYLEGNTYADRFQWSRTIGRVEDRPGHFNSAWGYWSSDGMGLDEYLQMAELIGARPVLAVFAGYTLNGTSSTGAQLTADVQDAVNELHYVLDPVSTSWGALRAANGHPAPYDVREVEIGNEDFFSSTYGVRYPLFYDAIHAAFPALKIIATHTDTGGRPYDVLDEHYYPSPATMQARQNYFDGRSRGGPKVFVGEWASMEGNPTNDMNAALGDATWLLGMMENSDLVTMQSYAPLWANVNGVQWSPDLIGYNVTDSYGSPGYYVQVMLANNHGASVVSSTLAGATGGLRMLVTRTGDNYYLAVVNVGAASNNAAIHLSGVSTVWPTGTAISLSALSASSTNSVTDPDAILPVSTTVSGLDTSFAYEFPGYSLTILKITANNAPLPPAPTITTPAAASPVPVTGVSTTLSVGAGDAAGEANLTYQWAVLGAPPAPVTFSSNGTNAAKSTVATFHAAGTYLFEVTVANPTGRLTTSTVSVLVTQRGTGVRISPLNSSVEAGASVALGGWVVDQFGLPMQPAVPLAWALTNGIGTLTNPGFYTAPSSPGVFAAITATAPGLPVASATIAIVKTLGPWYPADPAGGLSLLDASGQGKNAPLTGSYSFGPGVIGSALNLTGGYASLPTGVVSNMNDFTIATWVKVANLANWTRIFDFGSGTAVNMFLTPSAGGTNALRFAITTGGGGGEQRLNGSALAIDTWTHVAVTLAGSAATLYVNGAAVATGVITLQPSSLGNTTANYLGKSQYNDPAFQGSIDDFRIYPRALSTTEVQSLFGGVIQGVAFHDNDGDGVRDAGEQPLGGAAVYLDVDSNGQADDGEPVVVTDGAGQYTFANLAGGTYAIRTLTPPGGYVASGNGIAIVSPMAIVAADLGQSRIDYSGTSGDDQYFLRRTAGGGYDVLVNGVLTDSLPANVPSLRFALGQGADTLTIDSPGGFVTPPGGISTDADVILAPYTGASPVAEVRLALFESRLGTLIATPNQRLGYQDTGTAVVIKLVLTGDANLDGRLNGDDLALMDIGRLLGRTTWTYGDFNYDGIVNASDATLLYQALAAGSPAPAASVSVVPDALAANTTVAAPSQANATVPAVDPHPKSPHHRKAKPKATRKPPVIAHPAPKKAALAKPSSLKIAAILRQFVHGLSGQ